MLKSGFNQAHLWWMLITMAMPTVSEHAMAAEARNAVASAGAEGAGPEGEEQ